MSKGEDIIAKILKNAKINFSQEKTFHDLKNGHYRYDFYIPDYKGSSMECSIINSLVRFLHHRDSGWPRLNEIVGKSLIV